MEGMDLVIHAAARKVGRRVADYMIDNRDTTLGLYDLAAQAGVKHFIFISSAASLLTLFAEPQLNVPEDTPANIHINWAYARSKAQAEHGLLSRADLPNSSLSGRPQISIVRPGLIWGEASPFHQRMAQGQIRLWGPEDQLHTTIHIDNLNSFIRHLLAYEGPQRVFHPQDPDPVQFAPFCTELAEFLGAPEPMRLSPALMAFGATFSKLLIGLSYGRYDPGLQGIERLFGRSFTTDDTATRLALNWTPHHHPIRALSRP